MEGWTYIKVILPLKLAWEPYYKTSESGAAPGMRVTVGFAGRNYVGVISETGVRPDLPEQRILEIKKLESHLDPVGEKEMKLWRFISEYYLCTIGEVYRTAYPSVRISGEQVSARSEERHEAMKEKALELYRKRLERLSKRLKAKEEALEGRHGPKVMHELESAKSGIIAEMKIVQETISAMMEENGSVRTEPQARKERIHLESGLVSKSLESALVNKNTVLLEGGISRIDAMLPIAAGILEKGRSVLMLVPEISLSKQLQVTLNDIFGSSLVVFHSGQSAVCKRSIATTLRQGESPMFILGTLSALFLPFKNLGLIIVEEEHDIAYKHDGTPRFMTRDTAVMLGEIHGAKVILSSPAPSLESVLNCISGRYGHVFTPKDGGRTVIVDTTAEKRKRGMVGNLSRILIKSLDKTVASNGKALILRPWGRMDDLIGEVEALFPGLSGIETMSIYEARRKDIDGYGLVAVVGTDILLDKQDFRADERTIQTLAQFRARFSGTMLIQTKQAGHPVFTEGEGYMSKLLSERKVFHYPPYSRIVDIIINDNNASRLKRMSHCLADILNEFSPAGPFTPFKGKDPAEGTSVIRIMLSKDRNLTMKKQKIAATVSDFEKTHGYSGHITLDVDPV